MPLYEYQGQQYDIPDTDPAIAKSKILAYLGESAPAAPAAPAETPAAVTYAAAAEKIKAATPEPVRNALGEVVSLGERGFKALPETVQMGAKATGNFLLDALDIINRPFQAVAGGAKEMRQLEREQPPTDMSSPFGMLKKTMATMTPEAESRVKTAALKGLKGETKTGMIEALPEEYRKENPILSSIIGFAGDVVLDKAATVAPFQVLKETVIKPVAGAVSVPGMLKDNELYKAISLRSQNIDKADEIYNEFRYARDKAVNEGIRDAKALNNEIKVLSKKSGIPVNDLKAKIINDIEIGQLGDDAVSKLEQGIIDKYKTLLAEQQAVGIKIGDKGETYIPHMRSAELDNLLNTQSSKAVGGGRPSGKTTQALPREIEGTVAEINAKAIYGDDYKMFRNDPAVLQGVYEYKAANAIAGKKVLEKAKELGLPKDAAPKGWVTIPEIEGYAFPPEVKSRIVRMSKLSTNDEAINGFLKVYDGATNWWKMWSLGARPSYHAKNTVGNLWNNYLGGLTDPVRYKDAAVFQYKLAKNDLTGNIYGKPLKELYDEMANRGIIGEGQYGADIAQMVEKKLGLQPSFGASLKGALTGDVAAAKNVVSRTVGTENPLLKAGFGVGSTIEDNARVALFLDQVKKGASYEQAAKHVQKYLFDYGALSPLEQTVAKRVMPFYTWTRKNLPLQLEALVMSPDKINKINLLKQNAQAGVAIPDVNEIPDYVKEQMPIYVGNPATGGVTAIPLSGILPFADINILTGRWNTGNKPEDPFTKGQVSGTISTITGSVNPFIKVPAELAMNYNLFRKQTIEEYKDQKVDMLGVRMPAYYAHVISNLVMVNELDRLNPGGVFGTRTVDPATKLITSTPSIFGVQRESRTDLPEAERALQAGLGLRFITVDPKEVDARNWSAIKKDVEQAKSILASKSAGEKNTQANDVLNILDQYLIEIDKWDKEAKKRKSQGK